MNTQMHSVSFSARVTRVLLPAAILVACSGDRTTTEPVPIAIDVALSKPVLTRITDSASIDITANGVEASSASVELVNETRGIANVPVIVTSALARRMVVPSGPGVATLRVRSGTATPKTFTIQVAFERPTILAAQTTSRGVGADTTTLIGVMLDQLAVDGVRVDGELVELLSTSPTKMTFILPPAANTGCGGGALASTLSLEGGDVAPGVQATRARDAELRMAVGEWRRLEANDVACLELPAARGAYVLAYADMRQIDRSRAEWPGIVLPPDYSVNVDDRTSGFVGASIAQSNAGPAAGVTPISALHAADMTGMAPVASATADECQDDDFVSPFYGYWCRSKPWAVGDKFIMRRPGTAKDTATATIYQIYDNHFVFAIIDGDNSTRLEHMRAMIDQSMPLFRQHALPFIRTVFGDRYPTTSKGSGQLLTIIGDFTHGSAGGGCCFNGEPTSVVFLGSTLDGTLSQIFYLLSHEFTHTWQRRWYFDTRSASASPLATGSYWGTEGGADLVALEAGRRMMGLPWRANIPVPANTSEMFTTPWYMESAASGAIYSGYVNASSFMRDVVARLVARGVPLDEAFTEAARGSLEDWFGLTEDNVRRAGFSGRMQSYLGATWEPGNALLLYTLSQGSDELTTNAELQNPFYRAMWSAPSGGFGQRTLIAGLAPQAIAVTRKATTTGYVRIEDNGKGSTFRATSDTEGIIWGIARVR
jgi:hypothetical protein